MCRLWVCGDSLEEQGYYIIGYGICAHVRITVSGMCLRFVLNTLIFYKEADRFSFIFTHISCLHALGVVLCPSRRCWSLFLCLLFVYSQMRSSCQQGSSGNLQGRKVNGGKNWDEIQMCY